MLEGVSILTPVALEAVVSVGRWVQCNGWHGFIRKPGLRCPADMQKDASGASAARGTFWPMRKFGAGNIKKLKKINEENHL